MGLLSIGTPLPWENAKKYADHVRSHGITQFLNIYRKVKDRKKDCLTWGDEVEYCVVRFCHAESRVKLDLEAADILVKMQNIENEQRKAGNAFDMSWKTEYGRYMLEGTPGFPYGPLIENLLEVEQNMIKRRQFVEKFLGTDQFLMTITNFPSLGTTDFLYPSCDVFKNDASRSAFIPDHAIAPHARFPYSFSIKVLIYECHRTLTANIRERRGKKVAINVPIFRDRNTPNPFREHLAEHLAIESDPIPDHIYMDCMCFGMGCSCLQVTFQACSIDEARGLYDQLATLCPIMLCITAAAPIFRGYLSDVDCRWDIISKSVDDRTEEELGMKPLKENKFVINKSRYDSIDSYISTDMNFKQEYNDIPLVFDHEIFKTLLSNGIDELLAKHISHLFIRDPLVIYSELLEQDDSISSDHFENIQSTNWQTMRFKPPPPNSNIGWRVEFRSMEVQFTEFENAAFSVFLVLVTRTILSFNLNFYIPISKVDVNMKRAQQRDALRQQKFFFRREIFNSPDASLYPLLQGCLGDCGQDERGDEVIEMSVSEIMNGKRGVFPGLIPLVEAYLDSLNVEIQNRLMINRYLDLIKKRSTGEFLTAASWMRKFVCSHPTYKNDSVVSPDITYDLCKKIRDMSQQREFPVEMFGESFVPLVKWNSSGD